MKLKIFFLILIIALVALAYFGYPIAKNRYFNNSSKIIKNNETANQNPFATDNATNNYTDTNPFSDSVPSGNNSESEEEIKSSSIDATISSSDCENECLKFQESEKLKYCKQVCGLPEIDQYGTEIKPTTDCANATGLEKDYCLKNEAIKNKDFKACEEINDSGIKKTCKNRVMEDIIESQQS